jgi:hypothetical protein
MKSGAYENVTTYVVRRNVTDRALRYRAAARPPAGPKICAYCGSRRNVEVDHVNGLEEDNRPKNLVWACRSCNTKKGALFARLGRGRKTRQFNAGDGARSLAQWVLAHESRLGRSDAMTVPAAVQMIHDTPDYRRKMFGQEIWARRRARGTDTQVPF